MEQLQIQDLPFCRLCFTQGVELYEIFPGAGNDNESLLIKIMDCVTVAVSIVVPFANAKLAWMLKDKHEEMFDVFEESKWFIQIEPLNASTL